MTATQELVLNVVDLAAFLSGKATPKEVAETAKAIVRAYEVEGFVYCTGYQATVPEELVEKVFDYNAKFFALPVETKEKIAYTTGEANRGWIAPGREGQGDQKETFEIGNDQTPEFPERWPQEEDIPGFVETMREFHIKAHQLNMKMMELIAISLDLPADFFADKISKRENNLRLLYYPEVPVGGSTKRLGAHTDDGSITLLWQDFAGGLEAEDPNGNWTGVRPLANAVLCNVGDLLERWSNLKLRATKHRAVAPPAREGENFHRLRRSTAYFCNPNREVSIECIPGLGEPKFAPINAGVFYAKKLNDNIAGY